MTLPGRPDDVRPGRPWVHGLLVAAVCLVAYSNTFDVPFQFDDKYHIAAKPFVRDIRTFFDPAAWDKFRNDHAFRVRTVGYFTFALNYRVHGAAVTGYHVVNLAIHILNALLVYALLLLTLRTPKLSNTPLRASSGRLALFAALLFAAHPVQTEAVTYIVQRVASLATSFYLLSVVLYARSRLAQAARLPFVRSLPSHLLSLASAILAMGTKEIAFTLPVIIGLYELLFFDGPIRRRFLILIPHLVTMLVIPLRIFGAGHPVAEVVDTVSRATRVGTALPRADYLFTEFRVIVTYLRLLVFPVNQNLDYDYPVFRSLLEPGVLMSLLFLAALLGLGMFLLVRDGRRPSGWRLVSFGLFWFFIALSVESSVIPIADVIVEHRLYLPSAGFFVAASAGLFLLAGRLEARRRGAVRAATAVLAAAVVALAGAAYARNEVWRSEAALWEDVMRKSPRKARSYRHFGSLYWESGDYGKSIEFYRRAIALAPGYADAYNALGVVYGHLGQAEMAAETLAAAVRLDPGFAEAWVNLGILHAKGGRADEAIRHFRRAVSLNPGLTEAHVALGIAYGGAGRLDEAADAYRSALEWNPDSADVRNNLGIVYGRKGEVDRAIEEFEHASRLSPSDPDIRANLARAFEMKGWNDRAEEQRRLARRLRGR